MCEQVLHILLNTNLIISCLIFLYICNLVIYNDNDFFFFNGKSNQIFCAKKMSGKKYKCPLQALKSLKFK